MRITMIGALCLVSEIDIVQKVCIQKRKSESFCQHWSVESVLFIVRRIT